MLKYTIKDYATPTLKNKIIEALQISNKTYYNKLNATIQDKLGFEACELLKIGKILNRSINELITPEALNHYLNDEE